jgi:hypothetical protein
VSFGGEGREGVCDGVGFYSVKRSVGLVLLERGKSEGEEKEYEVSR